MLKGRLMRPLHGVSDWRANRRWHGPGKRFLIVRHAGRSPYFHEYLLEWLAGSAPDARRRFELQLLPGCSSDLSQVAAFAAWLQDPAEDWLPPGDWRHVRSLEARCRAKNIPVINPVARLSCAVKSAGGRLIAETGVRTPRIWPIDRGKLDVLHELPFPLLIREDRHHGCRGQLIECASQLGRINWSKFRHPIAAEFVDVRDPIDGLVRKYRYVAAGELGVPRHLIVSRHWEVRARERVQNNQTEDEELAYLTKPDPNHETLQAIRRKMGLHLVAFDYSYDTQGELVVWEANPYANLTYPAGRQLEYTRPFVERSFAAIAAMYFRAAGMPCPAELSDKLDSCCSQSTIDNLTCEPSIA
jgi:hypothetical protein